MGSDSGSFDHRRRHHVRHHHQASPQKTSYTQTNRVSNGSMPAAHIADNLINPWSISHAPTGPFWISDNASGVTTVYDGAGNLIPVAGQDAITIAGPPGQTDPNAVYFTAGRQNEQHGLFGNLTVMSDQIQAMSSPMMPMQS